MHDELYISCIPCNCDCSALSKLLAIMKDSHMKECLLFMSRAFVKLAVLISQMLVPIHLPFHLSWSEMRSVCIFGKEIIT